MNESDIEERMWAILKRRVMETYNDIARQYPDSNEEELLKMLVEKFSK